MCCLDTLHREEFAVIRSHSSVKALKKQPLLLAMEYSFQMWWYKGTILFKFLDKLGDSRAII